MPYLLDLVAALSGGSRFWNEQTYEKAEDAEMKMREMFKSMPKLGESWKHGHREKHS